MNNSVVETGYLGHSPARSMKKVRSREPLTWIAQCLRDMKQSPVSSLAWGVGSTSTLYGADMLLTYLLTVSFAYTAPLIALADLFAGGVIASSVKLRPAAAQTRPLLSHSSGA